MFSHESNAHHAHHLNLWKYFKNGELNGIYFNSVLRAISISLISIFVPVYLYEQGYSFFEIMWAFSVNLILVHFFVMLGLWLLRYLKVKMLMAIGTIIGALFFIALYYYIGGVNIYWILLLDSLGSGIYFAGFHSDYGRVVKGKSSGGVLAILNLFLTFTAIVGPLIGAYLIDYISYKLLLILVSIIFALSSLPLFKTVDFKVKEKFDLKRSFKYGSIWRLLGYATYGFVWIVLGIMWPLYIFINLKSHFSLGMIAALTSLLLAGVAFYVGKYTDKFQERHFTMVKKASVFAGISLPLRILFTSTLGIFLMNVIGSVFHTFIDYPITSDFYKEVKGKEAMDAIGFREYGLVLGRIIFYVIFLFVSLFATKWVMEIMFALAGVMSLFFPFFYKHIKK